MIDVLREFLAQTPMFVVLFVLFLAILILGKSADKAIDYAIKLAQATGLSNVVIGATIVSLGTTFPEAVVSVLAAIEGDSGLALGNAVGSIICDTGLIMGLTCLLGRVPIDKFVVRRKGMIQLLVVFLLVILAVPSNRPWSEFLTWQGLISQKEGFVLVFLLFVYFAYTMYAHRHEREEKDTPVAHKTLITVKLLAMSPFIFISSEILILSSTEFARRIHIPEGIIAATIVALGTSLPELMTAISAIRRNACDLALGNILGADILNVLFVAGVAASVTSEGLVAEHYFFTLLFPAMLVVVLILQCGLHISYLTGSYMKKWIGVLLLLSYFLFSSLWAFISL